jgi:anti-sigma factor RsiW
MNCRSAESLFSSFMEDEVSQEERRALEAHLLSCRRCSLALRELRVTVNFVRELPEVAPSAHFEEDLFARIRSGEGLSPSWPAWAERLRGLFAPVTLRPLLAAGAGACAIVVGVAVFHPSRPAIKSATGPSAPVVLSAFGPPAPSGLLIASASAPVAPSTVGAGSAPSATRRESAASRSEVARVGASTQGTSGRDLTGQGDRLEPSYQDEYILDQFLLERTGEGRNPAIQPVNDTGGDVYITF